MIEAKWLFDVPPEQIQIAVHPQSIIHSMVQFKDGTIKAQLGTQSMKLPIQYALSFPERLPNTCQKLKLEDYCNLTFEHPDTERFPLLRHAFEAANTGGNMPCILNAANEIAVAAFLQDRIKYLQINKIVEKCLEHIAFVQKPTYEDYVQTNEETRCYANELITNL